MNSLKKLASITLCAIVIIGCGTKGKAADVNGETITTAEVEREIQRVIAPVTASGQTVTDEQMAEVRTDVLNRLIELALLSQASRASGVVVEDAEVESELGRIRDQFPSQSKYEETLKGLGLTAKLLEEQLRRDLLIRRHLDTKSTELVIVTDRDVNDYYDGNPDLFVTSEQVEASHILIQVAQEASEAEKKKAFERITEVHRLVRGGADFADTAREMSEGPSGPNGGALGFFGRGQMVGPFEEAAFALSRGEISGVVETQFGYHVIKVTDRRPGGTLTLDEVRENVREMLRREKTTEAVNTYVEDLRAKAEIQIYVDKAPTA